LFVFVTFKKYVGYSQTKDGAWLIVNDKTNAERTILILLCKCYNNSNIQKQN